ncbi:MAG: cytochrome c, partial [Wenzhouxiangella sp.]
MIEGLTRNAARNIFLGGSLFFFAVFLALTIHSHFYIINESTDSEGLTDSVRFGKHVWEENSCINCHSLLGEGAYFAPELGNVWLRYG